MLGELTDPRKTTEAQAQQLLHTAKPIYYAISGMHSPETGGPEMLIELAYRLIVEETPFIQNIRNNVITLITPVIEVDGREKQVDTYYFNKKRAPGDARLPLMYWGKYVQHDNNRDGMGQFLEADADRHEGDARVASDGDARSARGADLSLRVDRHRSLQQRRSIRSWSTSGGCWRENDVMEMTKRGVPGVWTYGFYDGWVPNYMFFIAHSHNSIGRFYEVQSYGPDPYDGHARADHDEPGMVPAESAAAVDQVGPAQQHQHPGVGDAVRAEPCREEQGAVSRELLAEEQARGGERQERPDLRLGDSGGAAAQGRRRRRGQRAARAGARDSSRRRARSRRAASTSRRATTSSAAISRTARSRTCTSRCRTTRRRTRRRTTTPAGRSSYMRDIKIAAGRRQERCSNSR